MNDILGGATHHHIIYLSITLSNFINLNMEYIHTTLLSLSSLLGLISATQINQLPCLPGTYTPYEYVGCFEDSRDGRALSFGPGVDFGTATIEKCTAACKANGYHYAGLEYYGTFVPYVPVFLCRDNIVL